MEISYLVPEGCPTVTPHRGLPIYHPTDVFSVILLGTGCPETTLGRGFPSTLVQYRGNYFLVDVAEGTNTRLAQGGIHNGDIKNVFFTHHHADHDAGYPYFLIDSWMSGRAQLNLVGPPKTRELHELTLKLFAEDISYRASRSFASEEAMYQANIHEYEDKSSFTLDGVAISTAKLTHTAHDIGFRFEAEGMVIVVSGDTSYDPALVELAKDADILVMDVGFVPNHGFIGASAPGSLGGGKPPGKRNMADCSVNPHPAPGELARMAMESGVKTLILTHFLPMEIDEEATIADLRQGGFTGEVVFGRDLMEYVVEKEDLA